MSHRLEPRDPEDDTIALLIIVAIVVSLIFAFFNPPT